MISEEILDAKSAELYLYWRILGVKGWRKQNNKTTTPNAVGFRLRQGHHTGRGRKSAKASSKEELHLEKMALMVEASMTTSFPAPRLFLHLPITCLSNISG